MIMLARVTMMVVIVSLLVTINASSLHTHQVKASNEIANDCQPRHPTLPRKLIININVERLEAKNLVSSSGQSKHSPGESNKNQEKMDIIVHAAKGTRREWIEGSDTNHEFFTMDYSHVRRRRPIHNRFSPRTTIINAP